jgi:hypothetical protein
MEDMVMATLQAEVQAGAPLDIERLIGLVNLGTPLNFSECSDEEFLATQKEFIALTQQMQAAVARELEERGRGIAYCDICGRIEVTADPEQYVLEDWKLHCQYFQLYIHTPCLQQG